MGERRYFGTDGIRRPRGGSSVHVRQRAPPSGRHRQGHASVRLHDRTGPGGRLCQRRNGRADLRPPADTGRGHDDPVDARRYRGDDLGLAQQLRRQWHQTVRPGRLQAVRHGRAEDRIDDGHRPRRRSGRPGQTGSRQTDRRFPGPLYRDRQGQLSQDPQPAGPAHRHRLRQRGRLSRRPDHPL